MRLSLAASVALLFGSLPIASQYLIARAAEAAEPAIVKANPALDRVKANLPGGDAARARGDAEAAARSGQFGLIETGIHELGPAGVICFTPLGQAPETLFSYEHGDAITPDISAAVRYARAYNLSLVDRPDYPHAELCRAESDEERGLDFPDPALLTKPAREIDRPPRDLFEAARRGSADDVRSFLKRGTVDELDSLKMTALAWSVARNNRPAIDLLLAAGADPWKSESYPVNSAVYIAAGLGRWPDFRRLSSIGEPPFGERGWDYSYLRAAMTGGNLSILNQMLSQPNMGVQIGSLTGRPIRAEMFDAVLKKQPQLADKLLIKAVDYRPRADLVRVALAHGANANARERPASDTVLTMAANGIYPDTVEIVAMLLKAGADPNGMSNRRRPVWAAVRTLTLDRDVGEVDQRAMTIFNMLIAAGADLKLPDDTGRPPIWFRLFPYRPVSEVLDASYVTPQLLEMLVRNGMDVNAEWKGKRVLGLVEAQAGRDSELATTLRRLGARP